MGGFTGVFAKVWDVEKWDWGEEFGEDGRIGTSVGCGVLRGKSIDENDFRCGKTAGLQGFDREDCVVDYA